MVQVVDGATFTGKTHFLRKMLSSYSDDTARYMFDDDWVELLISESSENGTPKDCVEGVSAKLSKYKIVCIDNMDFLSGRNTIQEVSALIFQKLDGITDFAVAGIDMKKRLGRMFEILDKMGVKVSFVDYLN